MHQAKQLLHAGYKDPACILARVSLEAALKDLCDRHRVTHAKLEKMNAQKATTELTAVKGESLKPDAETKAFAHVAANNGKVTVVGRDSHGVKVEESTAAKPLVITEHVDDNLETAMQVLQRTAY